MTNLQLIKQERFGDVQCDFYRNERNEIFMTINQLAAALEYAGRDAIEKMVERNPYLDSKEFSVTDKLSATDGKCYNTRVFTEDGVYEVTMLSNRPKAKEFRAWIRGVLKDIRKHGMYLTNEVLEKVTQDPRAFAMLANAYADEKERNALLEAEKQVLENKIEADKPLVNFANTVGNTSKLVTMSEMAKILYNKHLPIGRNRLFEKLRNKGILMQNNEPYQRYVDSGHFVVRDVIKGDLVYPQTMITGKGQKFIVDCLRQEIDEARVLSSGEEQPEAVAVKN